MTARGNLRGTRNQFVRHSRPGPFRFSDNSIYINVPASLASAALLARDETQAIAYLTARAIDAPGSGRVPRDLVERELKRAFSAKQAARVLHHPGGARYWTIDDEYLLLHGLERVLASFAEIRLLNGKTLTFPLGRLDSRPRRRAAMLAAVLATAGSAGRAYATIKHLTGIDRQTIAEYLEDDSIRDHILNKQRLRIYELPHQLPNQWTAKAPAVRTPMKLWKSLSSREKPSALIALKGTSPLRKRYYTDIAALAKAIQARERSGADVLAELLHIGPVYVGDGVIRRRYSPDEAFTLVFGPSDTSPPHYRHL